MDPVAQALAQRNTPPGARIREWWQRNGVPSPESAVEGVWNLLPKNVRQTYASAPAGLMELSPGAAIRDTLEESGNLSRATLAGRPMDAATALSGMALAALGIVPAGRFGRLSRGLTDDAVAEMMVRNPGMDARLADAKAFADQVEAKYGAAHPVYIDPDRGGSVYANVMRHPLKSDGSPHKGRTSANLPFTARFADHGQYYGGASISIDPISRNTLDDALAAIDWKITRAGQPPRVGISNILPDSGKARRGVGTFGGRGMWGFDDVKWEDWIKYGLLPPAIAGGMMMAPPAAEAAQ